MNVQLLKFGPAELTTVHAAAAQAYATRHYLSAKLSVAIGISLRGNVGHLDSDRPAAVSAAVFTFSCFHIFTINDAGMPLDLA